MMLIYFTTMNISDQDGSQPKKGLGLETPDSLVLKTWLLNYWETGVPNTGHQEVHVGT